MFNKKVLYIGQYTEGTTSKMRADIICDLLTPVDFQVIDVHIPYYQSAYIWRAVGFRYKKGPLLKKINAYIKKQLSEGNYHLVWVDKGIFIYPDTLALIRKKAKYLVHFTPDMAFYENKSKHFINAINLYDFLFTTKTREKELYLAHIPEHKLVITTQGYSPHTHLPHHTFNKKEKAVVFIGLGESSRYEIAEKILQQKVQLKLVGLDWDTFVKKHQNNPYLTYIGKSIYAEKYAQLISSSQFALGLLSKRFPELHTTRTFEIPACGTALITERNEELESFYKEDEVIFYDNVEELISKINYFSSHPNELEELTKKGHEKVMALGVNYRSIISSLLAKLNL